ncbi:MAG TPA: hypothetical protein PKW14_05380 [Bacteroidota bacterium]|nr:hypothetical protein [Bacteroidota bacterium]
MKLAKICKETLDALCKSDDLYRLSDLPEKLIDHIKTCNQCASYRNSLLETIELYKNYDIKLDKNTQKKLLCNACNKLKEDL